jgi:Cu-processing system ATP-binding protein
MISQIIFMQDGKVHFHKSIDDLLQSTKEQKISKAIASILKQKKPETHNPKLATL